jgi:hypothetical protein
MKSIVAIALVALCYAGNSHAACVFPKAPATVPDGETATKEQMLAAKKEFTQYNTDMTAYLNCIELEEDNGMKELEARGATLTTEQEKQAFERQKEDYKRKQDQKHDAAVDELTANVERFNQQLRAYNKKVKKG